MKIKTLPVLSRITSFTAQLLRRSAGMNNSAPKASNYDIICLSHLRWDFVFQRPQHLMTRAAKNARVFFFEEPIFEDAAKMAAPRELEVSERPGNVFVARAHLPNGMPHDEVVQAQMHAIDNLLSERNVQDYALWYYTPMALSYSRHLNPKAIIYDCMDELSLFKGAPKELIENEKELFQIADHVFTGGQSLYEAKREQHPSVHAFPSSIDFEHFCHARKLAKSANAEPGDQAGIPHPRMGFAGVIDERLDIQLLDEVAKARPDWHLVLLGPVVKIDPADLPKRPNIHYLGQKDYKDLPLYMAGWETAMMPFAINDATKFISPTKTPEYLAAGKAVVSTPIRDVVRPYGEMNLVAIAATADEFVKAAARNGMDEVALSENWLEQVDKFLSTNSWDKTWQKMSDLIESAIADNEDDGPLSADESAAPLLNFASAAA
jgi:UDP-galactopyranose mutase